MSISEMMQTTAHDCNVVHSQDLLLHNLPQLSWSAWNSCLRKSVICYHGIYSWPEL